MSMIGIGELVFLGCFGLILVAVIGVIIFLIVRRQQSPASEGIPCPHCGTANPPGNRFCGNCGSSL